MDATWTIYIAVIEISIYVIVIIIIIKKVNNARLVRERGSPLT